MKYEIGYSNYYEALYLYNSTTGRAVTKTYDLSDRGIAYLKAVASNDSEFLKKLREDQDKLIGYKEVFEV